MGSRDARPVAVDQRGFASPVGPTIEYGIVVGIDCYPAIGNLRGACADAKRFYQWLTDSEGGGAEADRVRLRLGYDIDDLGPPRPNRVDFDDDLDAMVLRVREEHAPGRARLWLYFAGHGTAGAGTAAWLMADARKTLYGAISVRRYQEWLDLCRDFDEVVILSDCCRRINDDVQELPPPHTRCVTPAKPDQFVFLAHAAALDAFASEEWQPAHGGVGGHFTAALLEGLRGEAGNAGTGEVSGGALARHLKKRVLELSGERQHVEIPHEGGDIVLTRCWRDVHPVRIVVTGTARPIQIFRDRTIVADSVPTDGTWQLSLRNGSYQIGDPINARYVPFSVSGGPVSVVI